MPYDKQVQFADSSGARAFGNVRRAGQTGAFYLDKPLQGENIFEAMETTSSDTKKSEGTAKMLTSLFGGTSASKSQSLDIASNDQSYSTAFAKLLATADDALIKALQSGRE